MQDLLRGASLAFFLRVTGAGIAFGFNILLARTLDAEGSGLYFMALMIITIAAVLGRVGLDHSILRLVAANAAIGNWGAVKGVYWKGMCLALAASAAAAAFVFLLAPWIAADLFSNPALSEPLRWMTLAVIPVAMLNLNAEALKGLKQIRDSQLIQGVGVPFLSLVGFYFFGRAWGVDGAVWAYTIASIVTAVIGCLFWKKKTSHAKETRMDFEFGELFRPSILLFWVALMNLVLSWAATGILGIFGSVEEVGIFSMAFRTALLTSFVLLAVNGVVAPKFAAFYRQGDMSSLSVIARQATWLMAMVAGPLLIVCIVVPEWIMSFFGPEFIQGANVLTIIAVGQFVNTITGSVSYLLIMSEHERLLRNNSIFSAILNVALCFLLIPYYGMIGAAIATSATVIVSSLILAYFVWSRLGIVMMPFFPNKLQE